MRNGGLNRVRQNVAKVMGIATFAIGVPFAPVVMAEDFICRNGDSVRTIEVVREDADKAVPCRVKYVKKSASGGQVQFPWQARNEVNYCESKASSLAERLRGFGWRCEVSPKD
jgi:hypothetical protein